MAEDRIEGAARNGLGHVQDGVGGLTGDAEMQGRGKLNEIKGTVQNAYGKVKDQADETLGDVLGEVQGRFGEVQDRAQAAYGDLEQYIREKPLMSVGVAVLAGALLWHMIGGNRKIIYVRK